MLPERPAQITADGATVNYVDNLHPLFANYHMISVLSISVDTGELLAITMTAPWVGARRPRYLHGTDGVPCYPQDVALSAMFVDF